MGLQEFQIKEGLNIEGVLYKVGSGTPEGSVTAPIGSKYSDTTNGVDYVKKTGVGNTGWEAILSGAGASSEDGFQNTFMGKSGTGSEVPTYTGGQASGISNESLETAIDTIDQEIGAIVVPVTRTNNPILDQAVNLNIDALDEAIGTDADIVNEAYIDEANSVQKNLDLVDVELVAQDSRLDVLEIGQRELELCLIVTADDVSAKSGTGGTNGTFTDDGDIAYTLAQGDRILSEFDNKIYTVDSSTWVLDTTLQDADAMNVTYDFLATADNDKNGGARYALSGSTLIRTARYNQEAANTIDLSGSYSPANGNPASGENVEKVIGNLDANQDDIQATLGVAQGEVSLGDLSGASEEIVGDSESVKDAIVDLADEIGVAVTNSHVISDQAVNLNLDDIDTNLELIDTRTVYTGTPSSQVLDTVTVSDANSGIDTMEWIVRVHDTTNSKKYAVKIFALADVGATTVDHSRNTILRLGTPIAGLAFDVTISGSVVSLEITASVAVEVKTQRIVV